MTKTTKTGPEKAPLPSFDEFRTALKYFMMNDAGMPDLVAEEILLFDADFVESARQKHGTDENLIANTSAHLCFEPRKGMNWVCLDKGDRKASEDQIVLDADGAVGTYLDSLVKIGLHGKDRDSVAIAMLARGIESVLPLIDTKPLTK